MNTRMGRPPKAADEQLSEIIAIRMTGAELKQCEQASERAGVTLSAWIRDRAVKAAKRESKKD